MEVTLWEQMRNKCLEAASLALESETAPTAATVETVRGLVETAISIDLREKRDPERDIMYLTARKEAWDAIQSRSSEPPCD